MIYLGRMRVMNKKKSRTESANPRVATTPTYSLLILPSFLVIIFHRPGRGLSLHSFSSFPSLVKDKVIDIIYTTDALVSFASSRSSRKN